MQSGYECNLYNFSFIFTNEHTTQTEHSSVRVNNDKIYTYTHMFIGGDRLGDIERQSGIERVKDSKSDREQKVIFGVE